MCIAIGAAAASAISTIGTVTGIASTVYGIFNSQAQAAQQQAAAQQQMNIQYATAQREVYNQRQQQMAQYKGQVDVYNQSIKQYEQQQQNTNLAANRTYVQEQAKLKEVRDKAAFQAQKNYAKAIGNQGKILATGATGQSIGLLARDVDRQQGFLTAQQDATVDSAEAQAGIGMSIAETQARSSLNQAFGAIPIRPTKPQLVPDPIGVGDDLGLGIPSYNWD